MDLTQQHGKRHLQRLRLGVLIVVTITLATFWCVANPNAKTDRESLDRCSYPLARTDDDPISALADSVDLLRAPDFKFSMGVGSAHYGEMDTIKIAADGQCRYVFHGMVPAWGAAIDPRWRRAEFVIDSKTLADLRKLLVDIDFFRLKKVYRANVADGTQAWALVQASGIKKGVYCDNHFPKKFQKLQMFILKQVIRAHDLEMHNAPVIDIEEARRAGAD
jgi:hypothetical protein